MALGGSGLGAAGLDNPAVLLGRDGLELNPAPVEVTLERIVTGTGSEIVSFTSWGNSSLPVIGTQADGTEALSGLRFEVPAGGIAASVTVTAATYHLTPFAIVIGSPVIRIEGDDRLNPAVYNDAGGEPSVVGVPTTANSGDQSTWAVGTTKSFSILALIQEMVLAGYFADEDHEFYIRGRDRTLDASHDAFQHSPVAGDLDAIDITYIP